MTDLKVIGEITPPDYKDPATMLRNIADQIDAGDYSTVYTVALALFTDDGHRMFGGGRDSGMEHVAFTFGVAQQRLLRIPLGGE